MVENNGEQNQIQDPALLGEQKTEFVEISFDEDATRVDWDETLRAIRFYALPLLSFIIFVVLLFFTVIPNIQRTFATIDEINILREDDEKVDERIKRLVALRAQQAQRQVLIDKINEIVPTGTSEVVNFRQRVVETARSRSIFVDSSLLGEDQIGQDPNNIDPAEQQGLILIEIPSEFGFSGGFLAFRDFLNDLYSGEDFFVVREMSFSRGEDSFDDDGSELWTASLDLVKYQFFTEDITTLDSTYRNISEQVQPNQFVISFLESRFVDVNTNTEATPNE